MVSGDARLTSEAPGNLEENEQQWDMLVEYLYLIEHEYFGPFLVQNGEPQHRWIDFKYLAPG